MKLCFFYQYFDILLIMDDLNKNLMELFSTVEEITGLEICVFLSEQSRMFRGGGMFFLPHTYSSHFGEFCRIVKSNRSGRGCGSYDKNMLVAKSAEVGGPFVNICHAGLGEVIIPVYGLDGSHVASVFIGQVIFDEIDTKGFAEIMRRVKSLGVDENKLKKAYLKLPRMSREKLLRIGKMVDLALRSLGPDLDFGTLESRELLKRHPQIARALEIISTKKFNVSEAELAEATGISTAYFSRLFKKVMKCKFQNYVNNKRLDLSRMLLHHTKLTIMEIADQCGFCQQSYFTQKFREVLGMTPSQYRKHSKSIFDIDFKK